MERKLFFREFCGWDGFLALEALERSINGDLGGGGRQERKTAAVGFGLKRMGDSRPLRMAEAFALPLLWF